MAKNTTTQTRQSGPDLMAQIIEQAGRPVHTSVIVERTLAADKKRRGNRSYKGKTPGLTMSAQLATSNAAEGRFERVAPGVYTLRAMSAAKKRKAPVMPAPRAERKVAQPAKRTRGTKGYAGTPLNTKGRNPRKKATA